MAAVVSHRPARDVRAHELLAGVVRGRRGYRARQLLRDPVAHHELAVHGYTVTAPALDAEQCAAAIEGCHRWLDASPPPADGRFHSSFEREPTDAGAIARAMLAERLLPALGPQLTDDSHLRPTVFQCKPPGGIISGVRCHQDSAMVDEREAFGIFAWVALTRVRTEDGAMVVLPGSHRYGTWSRASSLPDPFEDLHPTIERHAKAIELEPGQVLWMDHALIHGSLPNLGTELRIGASARVGPKDRRATFTRLPDPAVRDVADVWWYPPPVDVAERPSRIADAQRVATVGLDRMAFSPAALDRACRLHERLHPGARGAPVPAGISCRP